MCGFPDRRHVEGVALGLFEQHGRANISILLSLTLVFCVSEAPE
jgi:hypothetical protein